MQPDWVEIRRTLKRAVTQRDRLNRREMFTWTASHMIAAMPFLYLPRMKQVPAQGIEEQREDEFLVNCPCGRHPVIDASLDQFQKCGGCERHYVSFQDRLWVLYGGMPIPQAPQIASSA